MPPVTQTPICTRVLFGDGRLLAPHRSAPSFDWVSLVQYLPDAPPFGGDVVRCFDPASGELKYETRQGLSVEGSFCSAARVRSHGGHVSLSFNPSRWGRPDSLDGLRSMVDVLAVANEVLAACGLPPFFEVDGASGRRFASKLVRGEEAPPLGGVSLSRVDVCQLFQAGSDDDARLALLACSQLTARGQVSRSYGRSDTVSWFSGSRRLYVKMYLKGPELLVHGGPDSRDAAAWASSVGLVRHEVELKRKLLAELGLLRPSSWDAQAMEDILAKHSYFREAAVSRSGFDSIADELQALGVSRARALRAQHIAAAYAAGQDPFASMARRTGYRVRADLLRVGLDIRAPLNVVALSRPVRVIELKPVCIPAQFCRPARP